MRHLYGFVAALFITPGDQQAGVGQLIDQGLHRWIHLRQPNAPFGILTALVGLGHAHQAGEDAAYSGLFVAL